MIRSWLVLLCLFAPQLLRADSAYAQIVSFKTQAPKARATSLVTLESAGEIKNIELNEAKNQITLKKSGLYFIAFTGQIGALNQGTEGYMDIWLIQNGKPVVNWNNRMYLSRLVNVSVFPTTGLLYLTTGDTLSVGFSTSGPNIGLLTFPPEKGPQVTSAALSIFMIQPE